VVGASPMSVALNSFQCLEKPDPATPKDSAVPKVSLFGGPGPVRKEGKKVG